MHKPEMENKRIQYSRDFLLSIQFMADCMQKPEGLPSIPDVVLHKELFPTVRGFLNKLTQEMFNQLIKQVKELHIDTEERLKGVVELIFEKAIDEPNFSVGYRNMCKSLAAASNREGLQDELEEAKNKAHRKTKGSVRFIEELFKLRMLTESIIHNCV
ncbi:eukaryotic translation initiation factor 4 gamma 3 isoform X1, partial [Silurus asotus]